MTEPQGNGATPAIENLVDATTVGADDAEAVKGGFQALVRNEKIKAETEVTDYRYFNPKEITVDR